MIGIVPTYSRVWLLVFSPILEEYISHITTCQGSAQWGHLPWVITVLATTVMVAIVMVTTVMVKTVMRKTVMVKTVSKSVRHLNKK